MHQKTIYVVGFITDATHRNVVLVRKGPGTPYAGKLNGVGGRTHHGESPVTAMRREAAEECGLRIIHWTEIGVREGKDYKIHFFTNYEQVPTSPLQPGPRANPAEEVKWYLMPASQSEINRCAWQDTVEDVDYCFEVIKLIKRFNLRVQPFYITERDFIPKHAHPKGGELLDTIS